MFKVIFRLKSVAPLFFGKHVTEKVKDNETRDQHELRTWPLKVHVMEDGTLFFPPFGVKNTLEEAAGWLGRKIKGEGQSTYRKRFLRGILVVEPLLLFNVNGEPATMDDIVPLELFVPSDGKRGGSKRVAKIFPMLDKWEAIGSCYIIDGKITPELLKEHLVAAGAFIGFGSMRIGNGGTNGRYEVTHFASEVIAE
jgi:hypothetical protein